MAWIEHEYNKLQQKETAAWLLECAKEKHEYQSPWEMAQEEHIERRKVTNGNRN